MKAIFSIYRVSAVTAVTVTVAGLGLGLGIAFAPKRAEACGDYMTLLHPKSVEQWAKEAVSENPEIASRAIQHLRALGQSGLEAMFRVHEQEIVALRLPLLVTPAGDNEAGRTRLKAALEAVAQQRDCEASKLFWYTDLDQAKAAAAAAGNKPILSLRLLGKLNEEYSCANSRFFRTTLYANSEVSAYLRQHFILHWQSVRPVPRITVDFGDGRRIERTITGNSIHYVLDAKGRVVDALPGLYGARAFVEGLQNAEAATRSSQSMGEEARVAFLRTYHTSSGSEIRGTLVRDLSQVEPEALFASVGFNRSSPKLELARGNAGTAASAAPAPTAREAANRAFAKSRVESSLLPGGGSKPRPGGARPGSERIENNISDETWQKIAALHADDAKLDQGARTLIGRKSPDARKAALVTAGKRVVEDPLLRSLRNLERSIAEDTVRNEYTMHTKIHEWLAAEPSPELAGLNSRVYAELFLTPDSDPWLGLVPADTYSALDNNGLTFAAPAAGAVRLLEPLNRTPFQAVQAK